MGLEPIKLTSREYDVLVRLEKTKEEIAEDLGVSIGLVNKYCYRLSAKLDVENRLSLVLKALRLGLVDLDDFTV